MTKVENIVRVEKRIQSGMVFCLRFTTPFTYAHEKL